MMFRRKKSPQKLDVRDLCDYGNPAAGNIDVSTAVERLGISRKTITEALAKTKTAMSKTFMRGISGRPAADNSADAGPLGKLQAAFGRGPRGGAVNVAAAARQLGVSVTTIRRWATGAQKPSPDHEKTLDAQARRATTTKAGRRSLTNDFRNSAAGKAATTKGATVRISGYQGPSDNHDRKEDYCRDRVTPLDGLSPQDIEDMLRSYENGGDKGLHEWMTKAARSKRSDKDMIRYHEDWEYFVVEGFEIEPNE